MDEHVLEAIKSLEKQIEDHKKTIESLKNQCQLNKKINTRNYADNLTNNEINRFSRQIILPDFGLEGQLSLRNAAVLIIGAGGLGCPSALYLAGAGIGTIGILDYDEVELNNLHRQVLHTEHSVGLNKVDSAEAALKALNSKTKILTFHTELNSKNAIEIIEKFDIIVDASDNVATRYLLNDASYLCKKPLVSGSALRMEGQLTVYHHGDGPCYRCLYPVPPPPATVTNCGEGGVLGVIPGTIGVLQALQVINIILKRSTLAGTLLLFDGTDCSFRRVNLRKRSPTCALCGESPTISSLIDYEQFCSSKANDKNPNLKLLKKDDRLDPKDYQIVQNEPHLLIDVRSNEEFKICQLPHSINIPIGKFDTAYRDQTLNCLRDFLAQSVPVFVVCRRGNDSQRAVLKLKEWLDNDVIVKDIVGGLHGWSREIDATFPVY